MCKSSTSKLTPASVQVSLKNGKETNIVKEQNQKLQRQHQHQRPLCTIPYTHIRTLIVLPTHL